MSGAEVAALLRERAGYVNRGLPARVALVDAALKARGYKPPRAERHDEPEVEVAVNTGEVETAMRPARRGR